MPILIIAMMHLSLNSLHRPLASTDPTAHSLSRKKQFLSLVTPALKNKKIKTLKEIKNTAIGSTHSHSLRTVSQIVFKRTPAASLQVTANPAPHQINQLALPIERATCNHHRPKH